MNKEEAVKLPQIGEGACTILGGIDWYLGQGPKSIKDFNKAINQKHYRVKNSATSSRVINYLENEGLLKFDRETKSSWRKFSFKELIYLRVLSILRDYGLTSSQLRSVQESFFGRLFTDCSNMAISYVVGRRAIYLVVNSEGFSGFLDDMGMELIVKKKMRSYIIVCINDIFNDIRKESNHDPIVYKNLHDILAEAISDSDLDEREVEIMKIIRDGQYQEITVKKTNEKKYVIKAEAVKEVKANEIMKMIENGEYIDVNVKKRGGGELFIKREDRFKI
jgi:hypothetical protein